MIMAGYGSGGGHDWYGMVVVADMIGICGDRSRDTWIYALFMMRRDTEG